MFYIHISEMDRGQNHYAKYIPPGAFSDITSDIIATPFDEREIHRMA